MKTLSCLFILSGIFSAGSAALVDQRLSSIVEELDFFRRTSRCTETSARALFASSNDVTIIVSDRSLRSYDLLREIFTRAFANRSVEIFTEFSTAATSRSSGIPARESSFLVIGSAANLRRLMSEASAERWAEYIIVVIGGTTEWLAKFANYLSSLRFVNVAFVRATADGRSTLVRPMEDSASRISPTILRSFDICEVSSASGSRAQEIRPFSSFLDDPSNRRLSFARILEGTEDPKEFATFQDGVPTSFGVDVLRLVAEEHGVELRRYEWPNQSESTWTDAMRRCLAGEFDYFYAVLPSSRQLSKGDIEAVAWYKYEVLTFIDKPKKSAPSLTAVLVPYRGSVWLCTVGLFGAFAIFAYAVDNLWQRGLIRERITILTIWTVSVDQSLPALPVKFGLRFVIGMWVLNSFLRNSGYTALFSSSLTAAGGSYALKSFQDIWDSGKPICGSGKAKELLDNPNDPLMYAIHNRFKVVHPKTVVAAVLNESCIGTRHLSFVERYNMVNRANESRRLYALSEATIIQYPSFYFSRKRNPYSRELKRIISVAHEVGIVKWIEQKYSLRMDKTGRGMAISTDGPNLRFRHLIIVFQILCVGHVVALFVFIIEIYAHARTAKRLDRSES